jgi:hypothetical protein
MSVTIAEVAALRLPGLGEARSPRADVLDGGAEGVVLVGKPGGGADRAARAAAAHQQRGMRLLHGLRLRVEVLDLVVPALERERAGLPRAVHDLDLLGEDLEPRAGVVEGEAVGAVLGLEPAGAHPKLHAAARDVIDRDGRLGEQGRMPEGGGRDERAETNP